MCQLPRESLKMPMINPNLGQTLQQSVVFDPLTGQSRVQTSVVPSVKRSIYEEIRLRPGFGAPFVDSYGDEGFFETGLPSKFNPGGSALPSAVAASLGNSGVAGSGIALNTSIPVANSGIVV